VLFEKYANLLQAQFTRQFEAVGFNSDLTKVFVFSIIPFNTQIVREDDHMPMRVETQQDVDMVLDVVWVSEKVKTEIKQWV